MADLDLQAGHTAEAGTHLREALEIAARMGDRLRLLECLQHCGQLCAAAQRWAEAITLWAAYAACQQDDGTLVDLPQYVRDRQEPMTKAGHTLGPDRMRAAQERGAAMTLATAVEFAALQAAAGPEQPQPPTALGQLSPRERELVTLVAQGKTDTQIAEQLYISVRTVRSHLDRIRDKTGSRRRADLTRLALQARLV
jgi:DNA-binding CsgD family transcriptional regulator